MQHPSSPHHLLRSAALIVLVGGTIALVKPVLVHAGPLTPTPPARAVASAPPTSIPNRTYHVCLKDGSVDYVTGDTLLVEDGSYLITENTEGVPQTVAAFPSTSVNSIALVSNEGPALVH